MRALAFLPTFVGVGALAAFTIFLFTGPFYALDLSLGITGSLVFDACLCFAFFLQHSVMIRKGFRNRVAQRIPKRWFGAVYAVTSGGMLFSFMLLWQESPLFIASIDGVYRWLLRGIFFLAIAGQIWITWSLGASLDLFGEKALRRPPAAPSPPAPPILMTGPYGLMRHPTYFTTLLMIWSYPDLTADRLLLNILFTVWMIVGTIFEERDLVAAYGEEYRAYQRAVPMFIPRLGKTGINR